MLRSQEPNTRGKLAYTQPLHLQVSHRFCRNAPLREGSIPTGTERRVLSHGNAIGVYFFDPEGNRAEVYCQTGLEARQPYVMDVDLERPVAELMQEVEESVRQYGATGIMQPRK
jgi:hypothetical protein